MRSRKILTYVFILAVVLVIGTLFAPSPPPREAARRISCANNLKQLGLALKQYAGDYGGSYPIKGKQATWHDLGLLYPEYNTAIGTFFCPSSKDKRFKPDVESFPREFKDTEIISYSYNRASKDAKALTKAAPDTTPLLADKKAGEELIVTRKYRSIHKSEGRNVLYNDGHVKWVEGVEPLDSNPETEELENFWSDPPYTGEKPKKKTEKKTN